MLFFEAAISIKRLEEVCELLHLEPADPARLMQQEIELTTQLVPGQEFELVSDLKLLQVARLVMNRVKFDEIPKNCDISELEGIRLLAPLDRMKMIALQPGNRVRLPIAQDFKWIPGALSSNSSWARCDRSFSIHTSPARER